MKLPRFGSFATDGYELATFPGPVLAANLDGERSPYSNTYSNAHSFAVRSIVKARTVSLVERGLCSPHLICNPPHDVRDDDAIHCVLHRDRCVIGAVRVRLQRYTDMKSRPLFLEITSASDEPSLTKSVFDALHVISPTNPWYGEISHWFVNPDFQQQRTLGLYLPACVWALLSSLPNTIAAVACLRHENGADSVMRLMGGRPLETETRYAVKYRGHVNIMTMSSKIYSRLIKDAVESIAEVLAEHGDLHKKLAAYLDADPSINGGVIPKQSNAVV